ncbi:MAG: ComF family protein [Eubacteriales bacterium]|nr:ComF family protein [Eubacteriales bacterium]
MALSFVDYANYALKLLYPPRCIFCGEIISIRKEPEICDECSGKLPFIGKNIGIRGDDRFDSLSILFSYEGIVKTSLQNYKFHDKPAYFRTYALLLAERIGKDLDTERIDMLMAVPLHRSRLLVRGYNQSRLISRYIGRKIEKPDMTRLIIRARKTEIQSKLAGVQREDNVRGAFTVKHREKIAGKTVLIIDDILTTGSTINECCRVLKEAGAQEVHAAAVASGRVELQG